MEEKIKKFIVMCVDISDSSDYKPRLLGMFDSREDAHEFVKSDMDQYQDNLGSRDGRQDVFEVDYDRMHIWADDYGTGCEWAIQETEV